MTLLAIKQTPISLMESHKTDVRTQFAALCFRIVKDQAEVLLITSRRSKRWIIPRGWPMDGATPSECAVTEAWEEAGVRGKAYDQCLGLFSYHKAIGPEKSMPCVAMVYPLKVKAMVSKYPETGQRKRKWMRTKKAASRVTEPELAEIIRNFNPKLLKR